MLNVGIIVSHRSIQRGRFPQSTRSMLDTAINRLNHIYVNKAFIQTAFDYEGVRILNASRTQEAIIEHMLKLNKKFDVLIFCPLVDGELGSGMKLELNAIKEANERINAEKQKNGTPERLIDIEPFVKERDDFSEINYPELMDKGNAQLEVCHWYKDDDDFLHNVYEIINTVVTPLLGATNGIGSDDKRGNKKKYLLYIIVAMLLIALCVLLLLNRGKIHKLIYPPTSEDETGQVVGGAEVVLNQGIPDADSPRPEVPKADSHSAAPTPIHQGQQCQQETMGPTTIVVEDTIEDNTFEIIGVHNPLRGYLSHFIKERIPELSKPIDGKKERWTVSVEQDLSALEIPKIIESDEYQIEIEYGINVKDNLTGKVIFENTITTRGRSPASLEDAKKHSRQLAAQEIAEQIKQCIQ